MSDTFMSYIGDRSVSRVRLQTRNAGFLRVWAVSQGVGAASKSIMYQKFT